MPDDLYARYQDARRAYQQHTDTCRACTPTGPGSDCDDGRRRFVRLARLQDLYLTRLKQRRTR
ncbi:hypothetical protein ACIPPJ_30165 [Streptomyces sp. NPDC086091]|uniref:hypothetical protein n=1 Tax=Streptomyces sp. NPDC086091 TaxID=3365751 RepID=UPI0038170CE4